jgi:hypothetical protein
LFFPNVLGEVLGVLREILAGNSVFNSFLLTNVVPSYSLRQRKSGHPCKVTRFYQLFDFIKSIRS